MNSYTRIGLEKLLNQVINFESCCGIENCKYCNFCEKKLVGSKNIAKNCPYEFEIITCGK